MSPVIERAIKQSTMVREANTARRGMLRLAPLLPKMIAAIIGPNSKAAGSRATAKSAASSSEPASSRAHCPPQGVASNRAARRGLGAGGIIEPWRRSFRSGEDLAGDRRHGRDVQGYSAARTLSFAMPCSAVGRSMAKTFSGFTTP